MKTILDRIAHLSPCSDAATWCRGYTSPAKAWAECPRGDWMLWIIGSQIPSEPWSEDRKPLLACCLDCAETVKHLWPKMQRPQLEAAFATLRLWIGGAATQEEAAGAAGAARAAARVAWAVARDAGAAWAAWAAVDAGAAGAAGAAVAAGASVAAVDANQKQCADIVRRYYPKAPKIRKAAVA